MFGLELIGENGLVTPGGDWRPRGTVSGSSDPFWTSVLLLLGNNQGPDTVNATAGNAADQSNSARTVTVVGTPTWTSVTPPSGLSTTIDMDAGVEGLTVPDSVNWQFAGDFCIETYFYTGTAGTFRTPMGIGRANGTNDALSFNFNPTGGASDMAAFIGLTPNGDELYSGGIPTTTLTANTWWYVAIYRSGANLYFADGPAGGTADVALLNAAGTGTIADVPDGVFLGGNNLTVGLDSSAGPLRITGGQARYGAGSFSVPALPLPTATT